MAAGALFLVAAVTAAAAVLGVAHSASYTVGAPAGSWDLQTNYTRWASAISFHAGDQLVFKYSRGAHDVLEVSKAGYDSCSASTPLASFATGDDTVSLPTGGVTRYFICGVPGHCAGGMKLAVRVEAAATASPSPAPVAVAPAPRAAARPPTASSAPSPAPVAAMAPREAARPPMATTPAGARAPAAGSIPAVPPSSSAAASARSLAGLGFEFGAAVAALMALY